MRAQHAPRRFIAMDHLRSNTAITDRTSQLTAGNLDLALTYRGMA
jgi:hypothetical protein